ncbi:uracil-DNA glycosylase family protein [Thiocystis violacea]|uniref:uracil-DNA glycosylase family protein n=1 Tax=Thiocystis violacea TaxID=13725 RepID=UPI001903B5F0|nr:uracil-DNA glycosylase family protein [Thiocystis violacea]MBK1719432.1 uracil-DNA glycosylase [Thiocystis violacea]
MCTNFDENGDPRGRQDALIRLHGELESCRRCPGMWGPPVHSLPVLSSVMLIGQAPGTREIEQKRPFCWTAGKTLFGWFASIGLEEAAFRERVLVSAVCRCFPGKNPKGGDRVPDRDEIERCTPWWRGELELLRPRLILPVGKLAISRLMDCDRLNDVVGRQWPYRSETGWEADIIPLPHSSGASTWFKMEPGRSLLTQALGLIAAHPEWGKLLVHEPRRKGPDRQDFA